MHSHVPAEPRGIRGGAESSQHHRWRAVKIRIVDYGDEHLGRDPARQADAGACGPAPVSSSREDIGNLRSVEARSGVRQQHDRRVRDDRLAQFTVLTPESDPWISKRWG